MKNILSVMLVALFLVGCVTVTDRPGFKIDKKKALDSHIQLGMGYLRANNRESAKLNFKKALEIDSDSAEALTGFALIYQIEKDNELADKYFKKSLSADGKYSGGRNNYGSFLYGQQRYEDAYDQFKIAGADLDYGRRDIALVNQGRAALKLGRVDDAEKVLLQAAAINPMQADAYVELAELKFIQGDYNSAKMNIDRFGLIHQPTARSLLLGIKIEKLFFNKDKEASYVMALKNLYPHSKEYLEYQKMSSNND